METDEKTGEETGVELSLGLDMGIGENSSLGLERQLLDYIDRCRMLDVKACVGGLLFDYNDTELVLVGLDITGLSDNKLKMDNVSVDLYMTLDLPFDRLKIDWVQLLNDYYYLVYTYLGVTKTVVWKNGGLLIKGLKSFSGTFSVDWGTVEFSDVTHLDFRAFYNARIKEFRADKVTRLDAHCFTATTIEELSLKSLSVIGRDELSALATLKDLQSLHLGADYKIDIGETGVKTRLNRIYKFLDPNKFTYMNSSALFYLFYTRQHVVADHLIKVDEEDMEYSYLKDSPKTAHYVSMNSLLKVPNGLFKDFEHLNVRLNSATYVDGYAFEDLSAHTVYLKNCKELGDYAFVKCYIDELYVPSLEELDLAYFQKYGYITYIYVGEHTKIINREELSEHHFNIEVISDKSMQDFERIYG